MTDADDDLNFNFPARHGELSALSDDDLATAYRKMAYANKHPYESIAEHEMQFRLVAALREFKQAADRSSRTLNVLTVVLVVLTVVLVVYAIRA
jgi:hypothetical protein